MNVAQGKPFFGVKKDFFAAQRRWREKMEIPNYETGITAALGRALEDLRIRSTDPSAVERLGTIKLDDGRVAEIQLFVTADPDLFVDQR